MRGARSGSRCIRVDGALVRVTADFDDRPDSEDMKALRALLSGAYAALAAPSSADIVDELVVRHRRPA